MKRACVGQRQTCCSQHVVFKARVSFLSAGACKKKKKKKNGRVSDKNVCLTAVRPPKKRRSDLENRQLLSQNKTINKNEEQKNFSLYFKM